MSVCMYVPPGGGMCFCAMHAVTIQQPSLSTFPARCTAIRRCSPLLLNPYLPSPYSLPAPPSCPRALLHVASNLPAGPSNSRALPPADGRVGDTNTGNRDCTGTRQVVLPSLPLHALYLQPLPHTANYMAERSTPCTAMWSVADSNPTLSPSIAVVCCNRVTSVVHVCMSVCMYVCIFE